MRFFTPELYERFNSEDDVVANAADEEWERAVSRYERHLKKIRPQLPESLRLFLDEYNLHDALFLGPARLPVYTVPASSNDVVIVTANTNTLLPKQDNTLSIMQYAGAVEPVVTVPYRSQVFHPGQPIWMYDEVDVVAPGVFQHEILLSDGRVINLKFHEFRFHFAPLIPVSQTTAQKAEKRKPTTRSPKAASA